MQSLLNSLNADDDTIKDNGGEMEESENTLRQWKAKYNSLMSFDDAANKGNTYNEATQDYWNVDSIGNNVAEGRESQTMPSVALISATLNALVSLSSLQKVFESGHESRPKGELVNAGGNKDAKGLKGWQAMRTMLQSLNTNTNTPSCPVRSKKLDMPKPLTRAFRGN